MKQLPHISVFEHETLYARENESGRFLSPEQLDMLHSFNDRNGGKYFTPARNGIKFSQYVGVIQVGRVTIEVLPKTDRDSDETKWHNVLLQMLAECNRIKRESVSEASLRKKRSSVIDLYIEMYLGEIERIVQSGFVKKYLRFQKQTNSLKGKILFAQNIRQNLTHKERFFTEHTIYTENNLYNQVLKKAIEVILNINCRSDLKDRADAFLIYFHNVSDVRVTENTFSEFTFARNTDRYKEALKIAELLILNYSPDIRFGSESLLAILFDMNLLWQEYVLIQLQKSAPIGISVQKGSKPFWERQPINPDIVIFKNGEFHVLDTKWKVIDQAKPNASDLKQMFAYNIYWNCKKSILLYPKTYNSPDNFHGVYHEGMMEGHGCSVCFIDLVNEDGSLNRLSTEYILTLTYNNK